MSSSSKRNADGNDISINPKKRNPEYPKPVDYCFGVDDSQSSHDDEINVIDDTGKIIPVAVKGSDTIDEIKRKIQAKEHISLDRQELLFKRKRLDDTYTLDKGSVFTYSGELRDFFKVFIKDVDGKLMNLLEVKPLDTIGYVKTKIYGSESVLMFNGVALENSGTLADFNVSDGSTLTRIDVLKLKTKIYVINTCTGKTISVPVTPKDTIANVKLWISYMERVPVDEQVLIFNGSALGDSGTLFDFRIESKSTLTLLRRSRGMMRISIKTFGSKYASIILDVNPSHTIGDVKSKIYDKEKIPRDQQELILNNVVLDNSDTLANLHINNDSTLTLARISVGHINIIIKMQCGDTIDVIVKPSNTIYEVISKIGNLKAIPRCQLRLLLDGRCLNGSAALADYQIDNGSTVDCVVHFPGDFDGVII